MPRRLSRLAALMTTAALADWVAACSTAPTSPTAPSSPAATPGASSHSAAASGTAAAQENTAVPTVVPLVTCQTTLGVSVSTPKALATSVTVSLPPGMGAQLAVYSDEEGYMMLLAPRGWSCGAGYGADLSGGVSVFPAGERPPSGKLPASSPFQEVNGSETSACYTCGLGQACPLFSSAAKTFKSYLGRDCPTTRPAAETVVSLRTGLVAFADPAGVSGDGVPSGGRYPANGVMTYSPHSSDGSWMETCTMPPADKGLCTAILDYFVNAYQSR
jgi:hypothetical protein